MKLLRLGVVVALLVGCAPKYQLAVGERDGYFEEMISPGIYRIHYQFDPQPVFPYVGPSFEQLLLLRAADLAHQRGDGYFIVDATALPGAYRGGQSLIVKFLAEPPELEGLKVYDAHEISSELRARHDYLKGGD